MFTGEEDVQATALRHTRLVHIGHRPPLGPGRQNGQGLLFGKRAPGERKRSEADPFDTVAAYVAQRLADDAHVWASALYDEVVALGYPLSYQSFTRSLRARRLRPHCERAPG